MLNTLLAFLTVTGLFFFLFIGLPEIHAHVDKHSRPIRQSQAVWTYFEGPSLEEVYFNPQHPAVHKGSVYSKKSAERETLEEKWVKKQQKEKEWAVDFLGPAIPVPKKMEPGEIVPEDEEEMEPPLICGGVSYCGLVPSLKPAPPSPDREPVWKENQRPAGHIPNWTGEYPDEYPKLLNFEEVKARMIEEIVFPEELDKTVKVRVRVLIDEAGNYAGHAFFGYTYDEFESAISEEIPKLRCKPAMANGKPVKSWIRLEISVYPYPPLEYY